MAEMAGIVGLFLKAIRCSAGLGRYAWVFLRSLFLSSAGAAAKIMALESQLEACLRRSESQRVGQFSDSFRFLWVILCWFWNGWERVCHAMKPRTVVRWKDRVFRGFWRWQSRGQVGRKSIGVELRKLIRQLSPENPLWGAAKIKDVWVDLGFKRFNGGTVRKYMPHRRHPGNPSGNWLGFIRNHMDVSWAMDFCVVRTIGFKALYVFVVLEHGRRRIRPWAATESPSLNWIVQQLRQATPFGVVPRYMHRDDDGLYGKKGREILKDSGIEEVKSAYNSPWQNTFVERFLGSLRRELLDQVIILHEQHQRKLLSEYVNWYENCRLHQGLG